MGNLKDHIDVEPDEELKVLIKLESLYQQKLNFIRNCRKALEKKE